MSETIFDDNESSKYTSPEISLDMLYNTDNFELEPDEPCKENNSEVPSDDLELGSLGELFPFGTHDLIDEYNIGTSFDYFPSDKTPLPNILNEESSCESTNGSSPQSWCTSPEPFLYSASGEITIQQNALASDELRHFTNPEALQTHSLTQDIQTSIVDRNLKKSVCYIPDKANEMHSPDTTRPCPISNVLHVSSTTREALGTSLPKPIILKVVRKIVNPAKEATTIPAFVAPNNSSVAVVNSSSNLRALPVTSTRPTVSAKKLEAARTSELVSSPVFPHLSYSTDTDISSQQCNKNAMQAKINREKKKAYISGLEQELEILRKEKAEMKQKLHSMEEKQTDLIDEVTYLKSILANDSSLANLITNINGINNVELNRPTIVSSRKRKLETEQAERNSKKIKSSTESSGICLHVNKNKLSLELCHHCAKSSGKSVGSKEELYLWLDLVSFVSQLLQKYFLLL